MKTFKEYILETDINTEEDKLSIEYPNGVYISVKLSEETENYVKEYQRKYLKNQKINKELHCTLIYSQKPQVDEIIPSSYKAIGTFQEFNFFGPDNNTLVVEINSQDLRRRNEELVEKYGFISDFDEYKSHVTLSYEVENVDLNSLPPMDFVFNFEDESVEHLDKSWGDSENEDEDEEEGTEIGKALKKMKDSVEKEENKKDNEDEE